MTNNLDIISSTSTADIISWLKKENVQAIHATNGIYAAPRDLVVPTTLAGFEYITDQPENAAGALVIAVNSDKSVRHLAHHAAAEGKTFKAPNEDENTRARKVLEAVAAQHPNRKVIGLYYDETTPNALYDALAGDPDINMKTLFKFGYGTDPKSARIEGAANFSTIYGFPFPNDDKPLCHELTVDEDQSAFVCVHDLTVENRMHNTPYLSKSNKVLFPVATSLVQYRQLPEAPQTQTTTPDTPKP